MLSYDFYTGICKTLPLALDLLHLFPCQVSIIEGLLLVRIPKLKRFVVHLLFQSLDTLFVFPFLSPYFLQSELCSPVIAHRVLKNLFLNAPSKNKIFSLTNDCHLYHKKNVPIRSFTPYASHIIFVLIFPASCPVLSLHFLTFLCIHAHTCVNPQFCKVPTSI